MFSGSGDGVHVSSGGVHGGKLQILCPPMRHQQAEKKRSPGVEKWSQENRSPKNRCPQKRGSLRTRFPNNAPSLSGPSENGAEEASPLPVHKGSVVRVRRKRGRGSKAGETPQRGKQSMGAGESLSRSPLREAPLSSRGIPLSSPFTVQPSARHPSFQGLSFREIPPSWISLTRASPSEPNHTGIL